jgi:hypothetical protein
MKASTKSQLGLWLQGIIGAVGIWDGLVQIATHNDPIFGGEYNPKGAAVVVVVGVFFLATAVSCGVKLSKDDDSDE